MGLLTRQLGIRALSMEDPSQPLLPYSALFESLGMGKSDAGVMVNEKQAMRLTTAFSCINIISTDLSSVTLGVFQHMPDGSVREAREHRLWPILHDEPNPWMNSIALRGAWLASALGWGNGYIYIRRDKASRVTELHLLPSDRTTPAYVNGRLVYVTTATKDGMPEQIDPANMLHLRGLTTDGILGLSPIQTCKNAFGLALAAEKFGAQFFGNGARATGVLAHPNQLDAEAYENIKKSVREWATGENALRPLIVEEGMTWEQLTIAPNDAQFLQTRQFQRVEIASLYRVAMHLLQDLQRATNNNIEHQSLDHLRYTLRPWAVRMEAEIDLKLLGGSYFSQHDFNDFQRGDFASQTAGFTALRNTGVYSANDILRELRKNPIPAEEGGDVRLAPLNMVPLASLVGGDGEEKQPKPEQVADPDVEEPITDRLKPRMTVAFRKVVRDAVGRIANRNERKPDQEFAYKALHPVVSTMGEVLVQMEWAGGLTEKDRTFLDGYASDLAAKSASWAKKDAAQIATELTESAWDAIRRELTGGA